MKLVPVRPYVILLCLWFAACLVGSVFGAAADGARSIIPNFLRYGLGVGAIVALFLAAAWLFDSWLQRE